MSKSLCFVKNCNSCNGTFYTLPQDRQRRKVWLKLIGKSPEDVDDYLEKNKDKSHSENVLLCGKHFSSSQYKPIPLGKIMKKTLKSDAIPDCNLGLPCKAGYKVIKNPQNYKPNESNLKEAKLTTNLIKIPEVNIPHNSSSVPATIIQVPQAQTPTYGTLIPITKSTPILNLRNPVIQTNNLIPISGTLIPLSKPILPGPILRIGVPTTTTTLLQMPITNPVLSTPLITTTTNSSTNTVAITNNTPIMTNSNNTKSKTPPFILPNILKRGKVVTYSNKPETNKKLEIPRLAAQPFESLSRFCRICGDHRKDLYEIYGSLGTKNEIAKKINYAFRIQVSPTDTLPLMICNRCTANVNLCYQISMKCSLVNEQLIENEKDFPVDRIQPQVRVIPQSNVRLLVVENNSTKNQQTNNMVYDKINEIQNQIYEAQLNISSNNEKWECPICKEIVKTKFEIIQHQLLKYNCRTCKQKFCTKKLKMNHRIRMHKSNTCTICKPSITFNTWIELCKHRLKLHPLICECCNGKFGCKIKLIEHIREKFRKTIECSTCKEQILLLTIEKHKRICKYTCKYCKKQIRDFEVYKKHMEKHSGLMAYQCIHCSQKFISIKDLNSHMFIHLKDNNYTCEFCNITLLQKSSLISHMTQNHLEKIYYICTICKMQFQDEKEVLIHFKTHNVQKNQIDQREYDTIIPYVCTICNKEFASKEILLQHKKRNHSIKISIKCKFCSIICDSKDALSEHMESHIEPVIENKLVSCSAKEIRELALKRYECKICFKRYSTTTQLIAHNYIHSGIKPFSCEYCESRFTTKANRNAHELKHKGIKDYKCDKCNKTFFKKHNLIIHNRYHTGEKPYECAFCNKRFKTKSSLNTHLKTHTGEKRFICKVCEKSFTQNITLIKHMHAKHSITITKNRNKKNSIDNPLDNIFESDEKVITNNSEITSINQNMQRELDGLIEDLIT